MCLKTQSPDAPTLRVGVLTDTASALRSGLCLHLE